MERERAGEERAMKGKDEESGLEKRENREVGQRQPTSVFCVQKCILHEQLQKAGGGRWRVRRPQCHRNTQGAAVNTFKDSLF